MSTSKDLDINSIYLDEVGEQDLIDDETEQILVKKAKEGNPEAREELIRANLKMVVSLAKKYDKNNQLSSVALLDLIQEGNIALIKCIDKYEFGHGAKFSTFAYHYVRAAISKAVTSNNTAIHIPQHVQEKIQKLSKINRELQQETKQDVISDAELAEKLKWTIEEVRDVKWYSNLITTSLDEDLYPDNNINGRNETLADAVPDIEEVYGNPQKDFETKERDEKLRKILCLLDERESQILRMRFGLDYPKACTLDEIGEKFNITKERIRQIEADSLRKMRNPMIARVLKEYMIA